MTCDDFSNGFSDHPLSFPAFNWQSTRFPDLYLDLPKKSLIIVDTRLVLSKLLYIIINDAFFVFYLDPGEEVLASRPWCQKCESRWLHGSHRKLKARLQRRLLCSTRWLIGKPGRQRKSIGKQWGDSEISPINLNYCSMVLV